MKVYFDNAATTPLHHEVIKYVTNLMTEHFGNPSSSHQFGRHAKNIVESARKTIAKHLNCLPNEIIFTAGGSEADNLILQNAIQNLGVKRIITSKIEHHAVLYKIAELQKRFKIEVNYVSLNADGSVNLSHLKVLLQDDTHKTLVSLMYINNEIANFLPLKEVSLLCKEYNAFFHSDTVQAVAHYKIDLEDIPLDFMAASAHKFHGPKGVGFAFIRKNIAIKPLLIGGAQEHGTRAGTENTHSIAGMGLAFDLAMADLEADINYIKSLKKHFIEGLKKIDSEIKFNGLSADFEKSSYVTLSVRFPKTIPMLLFKLDLKGIAASGGSACQSGSDKGSHVLQAVLSDSDAKNTSVRFSFSKFNTVEEVDYVLSTIEKLL